MTMIEMPVLKPVPIKTKGAGFFLGLWRWLTEIREWTLMEDYTLVIEDGTKLFVPKGFVFNGASIPKLFWAILSPTGLLLIPALFHDYAYRYGYLWRVQVDGRIVKYKEGAHRGFWDDLFYKIGALVNGVSFVNALAWLGVKIGGWLPWCKRRD